MTTMPVPAAGALSAAQRAVIDFTTVSLVIQWVGILVVGGLLLFLTQSIRRRFLDDWTAAWCCLIVALGALYLDFRDLSPPHHWLRAAYFLAEYGFGYLLVAGCRAFAAGTAGVASSGAAAGGAPGLTTASGTASTAGEARSTAPWPSWRWLLPAGAALALALTWISDDFNVGFAVHAAIVAGFLLAACRVLLRVRGRQAVPA